MNYEMTKYIKVDFPDSQNFIDNKECYFVISNDSAENNISSGIIMVPEDIYNEVMYKLQFPKKYENTNLGTIVLYENYAIVNGETTYWYNAQDAKKGDIALIYDGENWYTSKIIACTKVFPIILENSEFVIGINCEFIGYKKS